jgi:hypothetical protein
MHHQHSLLIALESVQKALSDSSEKLGNHIARVNSAEYFVTTNKGAYHVSLDDTNTWWNVFILHPMLDREPMYISVNLHDCLNFIYDSKAVNRE